MDQNFINLLESKYKNRKINSPVEETYCPMPEQNINSDVLTMAFVNMQPFESIYPLETAFSSGSLFQNINKPFYGGNIK